MRGLFLGLTLLAAVLHFDSSAASLADPAIGKKAPGFSARGVDGKDYDLGKLKGKTVVLEWSNQGCPFVQKHYESGNMQGLQKKYTAKGVVWLTIVSSSEGKEGYFGSDPEASAWLKETGASPSTLIRDPEGAIGRLYGAKATPHCFVISRDGKLAYKGAIDDKPSTDAADIAGSKNYLAAALDSVLAGKKVKTSQTKAYGCSVKYKG